MAQPDFYTMCATVFAPDGSFDEGAMRLYLRRQIDARLGIYLGSGGNGETHAMSADELSRLYAIGVEECKGKVPVHANLPEEQTAEQTIAQARIAIAAGVEALHLYTVEGRHGYVPTEAELIGYFDDVLTAIRHPVVIAVNPTMGYIPRPRVIAERPSGALSIAHGPGGSPRLARCWAKSGGSTSSSWNGAHARDGSRWR